jgi:hypothetical protein
MMKSVIDKHKIKDKLALVVTDNAANMLKARQLLVQTDGYVHIVEMRWATQAWRLLSILQLCWHGGEGQVSQIQQGGLQLNGFAHGCDGQRCQHAQV